MGTIIDLAMERTRRRRPPADAMGRLDGAVARLDPLVRELDGRLNAVIRDELLAISAAVHAGLAREAADRAERLADRLEHPAASGS